MSDKLPYIKFFVGDWMKDPAVRAVSLSARGLWLDMLCLMHEAPRRGYLQLANGKSPSLEQLARMTGCSTDEATRLLQELEDAGVFSRTEHRMIFARRMVSDEQKRALCSEAGKKGGNPTLKGAPKGRPKGGVKGGDNPPLKPSYSGSGSEEIQTDTRVRGDEPLARVLTLAEAWIGPHQFYRLPQWRQVFDVLMTDLEGSPVVVGGVAQDPCEILAAAIGSAVTHGKPPATPKGATAYLRAVINRCRTSGCLPGQFERAKVGPAAPDGSDVLDEYRRIRSGRAAS